MREHLASFFKKFDYEAEAAASLIAAYDKLASCEPAFKRFCELLSEYDKSYSADDIKSAIAEMAELSKAAKIHEYEGHFLLLSCYAKALPRHYESAGLDLKICDTVLLDLKYKLIECKAVKGIYGTFVATWFARFFALTRFAFEKLQFEIVDFGADFECDGVKLTPESKVINVHIPRTGGRLDKEARNASYAAAAEFFSSRIDGPIVFVCHSWLLFRRHKEFLKPDSNLLAFANDYTICAEGEYENYNEIWRLFDVEYNEDHSKLPANTSLRRAYIDLMNKGEKTGWARGVYVY